MMQVRLDCSVAIGASGAPTLQQQYGIQSITRLSAGRYRMQLQDNYVKILSFSASAVSPVTGSDITAGSFSVGTVYQITALGNTNWATAGLPAGITPSVGDTFLAAAVGSGTGTAKAIGNSGVQRIELMGNNPAMLSNQPFVAQAGGFVDFQCLAPTDASTTTVIPADPANGSSLIIVVSLSNSSVQ